MYVYLTLKNIVTLKARLLIYTGQSCEFMQCTIRIAEI